MSTRRSTLFYGLLIVLTSMVVGMVLASRLGLAPQSSAQTFVVPAANNAPLDGPVDATTFRDIAKAVSPAVVNIRTESRRPRRDLDLFGLLPPREDQPGGEQVVPSAGTGFIIDKSGLILTNNHVVEGTSKIEVLLYGEDDDYRYQARIIGTDQLTDSALIELTEKVGHELPEIKFGDSDQMQPGDWVMAIGNPFNLAHTVSVGVVSGLARPLPVAQGRSVRVIQTDAAINPGNSGGPLLNLRGEVIGINTAIYADSGQAGNIGIGFAVPINAVRDLLPQLRAGKVTRGRIGVNVEDVDRDWVEVMRLKGRDGALISGVIEGGAAARAGMQPGDVVIAYGSRPVRRSEDLVAMVTGTTPGTSVPVRIMRRGAEQTLNLTVDELDLDAENQLAGGDRPRTPAPEPETSRGFGMELGSVTPQAQRELRLNDTRGALITRITPGSPASRRLVQGDVIVAVNDQPVATAREANEILSKVPSGGTALLRVIRRGTEVFVPVTRQ
jgi:serine protease Do